METARRTAWKISRDFGQVAEEAGAAVASHDALGRAAQIEVDGVEAGVLNDAGCFSQGFGVGAEELGGDGMLILVEGEVALSLGFAHAREAVGGGELGHQEAAAGLEVSDGGVDFLSLDFPGPQMRGTGGIPGMVGCGEEAGVADKAAEDGVGDAGHGGEDGGGADGDGTDADLGRHPDLGGHGVFNRIVPVFLHGKSALGHRYSL